MVANVIGRDHGACPEGVLYFKIPLHIFGILEVAANVIQVRDSECTLGVEAATQRGSRAGVTAAAGTAGGQASAAIVIRQEGAIALGDEIHAAGGKRGGPRRRQVEGHGSGGHVEQVDLWEIRVKQAQEPARVKVGEETNAPANDRILADGAPGQTEPWLEDNFFDTRNDGLVAGRK